MITVEELEQQIQEAKKDAPDSTGYKPTPDTKEAGTKGSPYGTGLPSADELQAELLKDIRIRKEESKKQREQNNLLALMQAGLGMMGGTSPYAAANIGQGGQKGLEYALAQNKAVGDDVKNMVSATKDLASATTKLANFPSTATAQLAAGSNLSDTEKDALLAQIFPTSEKYDSASYGNGKL